MGRLDALDTTAETLFGARPTTVQRLHGGDLSDVYRIDMPDGLRMVAKTGPRVETEARMLRAIAATGAPAPAVLGLANGCLFLTHLPETAATPAGWTALGAGLRHLHEATGPYYGWGEDYAFGPLPISNQPGDDWVAFWRDKRLLVQPDSLPRDLLTRLERLAARLPDLLPHAPRPALLHGDLWTGNALFTANAAALIDPASYYGDPEVDLAMLHLFATPPPEFYAGYGPVPGDLAARRPLYQLWPALVHLHLFGPAYRSIVTTRLATLGV